MIPELEKLAGFDQIRAGFGGMYLGERVYEDHPLFKYLIPLADEIHPSFMIDEVIDGGTGDILCYLPSTCPDVFAKRYIEGEIDTSFKGKYEQADDLLATLEGYGIDKDAFWYLILFIKDFVDGQINGIAHRNTAKEDLEEIRDAFKSLKAHEWLETQHLLTRTLRMPLPDAKLEIKVDGRKYEYTNPVTLKTLSFCIDCLLPHMHGGSDFCNLVNHFGNEDDPKKYFTNDQNTVLPTSGAKFQKNAIYKQYLFHKYLSKFLEQYKKGEKQVAKINGRRVGISYDKMLLISRCIYIIGYTSKPDDTRFYEEYNEEGDKKLNTLKNILRKYKEVTVKTSNAYYMN